MCIWQTTDNQACWESQVLFLQQNMAAAFVSRGCRPPPLLPPAAPLLDALCKRLKSVSLAPATCHRHGLALPCRRNKPTGWLDGWAYLQSLARAQDMQCAASGPLLPSPVDHTGSTTEPVQALPLQDQGRPLPTLDKASSQHQTVRGTWMHNFLNARSHPSMTCSSIRCKVWKYMKYFKTLVHAQCHGDLHLRSYRSRKYIKHLLTVYRYTVPNCCRRRKGYIPVTESM